MLNKMTPVAYKGDYINGAFTVPARPDLEWTIQSPSDTNDHVIKPKASNGNVDEACKAARAAYREWSRWPMEKRKEIILNLKKVFVAHAEELAILIARETGKPLWETKTEVAALTGKIDITLEHSIKRVANEHIPNALPNIEGIVRFKSRGVMAVIGPFNFPAHLPNGHIIPALIMGNTIVYKPSEKTVATAQLYAQCFHEAGFPAGVFNMVNGQVEVGKRLTQSEKIDGVLFTGSYEVGLKIKQDTLEHYWKILALEMGGKNSTVIWDDADLEKATYETLIGAFLSTGQRCACTSKVIVHRKIRDRFLENFHENAKKVSIGHWSQPVFMGPLISQDSMEKYLRFQDIAKREGAEPVMRGKSLTLETPGYYVTPSVYVVDKPDPNSMYQKSEIFGPNVAVYTVDDFDSAMNIVNMSGYGLVGALFTKNRELYEQALHDMRVGLLNWNRTTNGASSRLPFGGMGKSGNDRPSANFAVDYCAVPVASLEDLTEFDRTKLMPNTTYTFKE